MLKSCFIGDADGKFIKTIPQQFEASSLADDPWKDWLRD